jgi:hypothetical protein
MRQQEKGKQGTSTNKLPGDVRFDLYGYKIEGEDSNEEDTVYGISTAWRIERYETLRLSLIFVTASIISLSFTPSFGRTE